MENVKQTMHLFAGVGGGLLADKILGHRPIIAVEWDKFACSVLRERANDGWFHGLQVWEGDVRLFNPSEYIGRVDIIHAGFPCQDISTAGKQAGVGEGTRSGLYREVLRIADTVRPRELFLENVSAICTNGLSTVLGDLAKMGYDARWLCIRASDVGANHHRNRWFLLARQRDIFPHTEHKGVGWWEQRSKSTKETTIISNTKELFCNVCDNNGEHCQSTASTEFGNCSCKRNENVAHSNGTQCQGRWLPSRGCEKYANFGVSGWWEIEPNVGRVVNGVSNVTHRLKGLGNAQVPLQAAMAYRLLGGK